MQHFKVLVDPEDELLTDVVTEMGITADRKIKALQRISSDWTRMIQDLRSRIKTMNGRSVPTAYPLL